ncbi:hypothetical protein LXA43DRAFT_896998 [Ganoderma leucocontextum]|nr:hypothetical protein LXA43DRAFT_896998 [Ganoderma leucocontextum]
MPQHVLHAIFDLLSPIAVAQLAPLSSVLDSAVASYWARDSHILASHFVSDVPRLFDLMDRTGTVFSGSAVVAALYHTYWRAHDLDVYCAADSFQSIVDLFIDFEGYELANPPRHLLPAGNEEYQRGSGIKTGYDDHPHILQVAVLKKGGLKVDIIQSASASSLEPVACFWTTLVQNFLSPNIICIAYPALNDRGLSLLAPCQLVSMQLPSTETVGRIRKYEDRGYHFATRPTVFNKEGSCEGIASATCPAAVRFFGDKHCLTLRTQSLLVRNRADRGNDLLRQHNVLWWRGGYTCGAGCGTTGMKIWPGMLLKGDIDG